MPKFSKQTLIKNMMKREPWLSYVQAETLIDGYWYDINLALKAGYSVTFENIGTLTPVTKPERQKYDINKKEMKTFPKQTKLSFKQSRNWNKEEK